MLAVFFQHKGAEETQGRRAVQGISGQEREEALTSSRFFHNQGFQLLGKVGFAVDAVQVEEDVAVEQGFGLGVIDPVSEIVFPDPQRLPPFRVGGHDVAGTVGVAALGQAVGDELGQGQEVVVVFFRNETVVQDHGVVLVCDYQLLVPGHGTQRHETVGHRWRAELFFAQFE